MPMHIYLPRSYLTRQANKAELTNRGTCRKCGRPYSWKVQALQQFEKPQSETEDNRTRAMRLFLEYKEKGIGPCCATAEHRKFIAANVGLVMYE